MKVYLVKNISGYYMGQVLEGVWTDRRPTIQPTVPIDMRGIEREILVAYWDYLWRLGEYSFCGEYTMGWPAARGKLNLERFVEFNYLKLWPTYGRFWFAVGATKWTFGPRDVMWRIKKPVPAETSRIIKPYDIILRYRERLWWAKSVFMAAENKWVYEQGPGIGDVMMFEQRGTGVAKKNEDKWNFGMTWWEAFGEPGKWDIFLWATAEVRYLGMGIRKSATILSLQEKKP